MTTSTIIRLYMACIVAAICSDTMPVLAQPVPPPGFAVLPAPVRLNMVRRANQFTYQVTASAGAEAAVSDEYDVPLRDDHFHNSIAISGSHAQASESGQFAEATTISHAHSLVPIGAVASTVDAHTTTSSSHTFSVDSGGNAYTNAGPIAIARPSAAITTARVGNGSLLGPGEQIGGNPYIDGFMFIAAMASGGQVPTDNGRITTQIGISFVTLGNEWLPPLNTPPQHFLSFRISNIDQQTVNLPPVVAEDILVPNGYIGFFVCRESIPLDVGGEESLPIVIRTECEGHVTQQYEQPNSTSDSILRGQVGSAWVIPYAWVFRTL